MQHVKNVKCQTPTVRTITMSKRDNCKVSITKHVKRNNMPNVKACQTNQMSNISTVNKIISVKCQMSTMLTYDKTHVECQNISEHVKCQMSNMEHIKLLNGKVQILKMSNSPKQREATQMQSNEQCERLQLKHCKLMQSNAKQRDENKASIYQHCIDVKNAKCQILKHISMSNVKAFLRKTH